MPIVVHLCRCDRTSKFSQEPPTRRRAGLVGRALGVSLNLRVSRAATPTCRRICLVPCAPGRATSRGASSASTRANCLVNPAHVPYWRVNNPTLSEFCFRMIGRADIEGSKSNVAMNAWLPQASYPCGTVAPSTVKIERLSANNRSRPVDTAAFGARLGPLCRVRLSAGPDYILSTDSRRCPPTLSR